MHKPSNRVKFADSNLKDPNDIIQQLNDKNKEDYGYYLMRTNYKRVKPQSKYASEGTRPRSPNTPYSNLNENLTYSNPQNSTAVFHTGSGDKPSERDRFYLDRHADTYNQHLIRGISASQPYCYIRKDAHSNSPPKDYTSSAYGAYPTWGEADTGSRTKSHYVAEPVERYTNIDMYRRPFTNQPGRIIFDYGRPNNGYYLQRNQYDNTWFNSNLALNKTNILDSIEPKTTKEYEKETNLRQTLVRSKTTEWPFKSEYVDRFTLKSANIL